MLNFGSVLGKYTKMAFSQIGPTQFRSSAAQPSFLAASLLLLTHFRTGIVCIKASKRVPDWAEWRRYSRFRWLASCHCCVLIGFSSTVSPSAARGWRIYIPLLLHCSTPHPCSYYTLTQPDMTSIAAAHFYSYVNKIITSTFVMPAQGVQSACWGLVASDGCQSVKRGQMAHELKKKKRKCKIPLVFIASPLHLVNSMEETFIIWADVVGSNGWHKMANDAAFEVLTILYTLT